VVGVGEVKLEMALSFPRNLRHLARKVDVVGKDRKGQGNKVKAVDPQQQNSPENLCKFKVTLPSSNVLLEL